MERQVENEMDNISRVYNLRGFTLNIVKVRQDWRIKWKR